MVSPLHAITLQLSEQDQEDNWTNLHSRPFLDEQYLAMLPLSLPTVYSDPVDDGKIYPHNRASSVLSSDVSWPSNIYDFPNHHKDLATWYILLW
ncbi:hypothetical protein D3C81_1321670 [compost metagenome]